MIVCQNYINVASVVKYSICSVVDVCVCLCTGCACVRLCEYVQKRTGSSMLLCCACECVVIFNTFTSGKRFWEHTRTHTQTEQEREREGDVRLPLGILTIKSKQFFKHPSNNNNRYGTVVVAVHTQQTDNTIADACETAYPYFRSLWQWFCRIELCNWNIFNSDIITVTTDDLFSSIWFSSWNSNDWNLFSINKLNSLSNIYILLL